MHRHTASSLSMVFLPLLLAACASQPAVAPKPTQATPAASSTVNHAIANLAAASGSLVSGRLNLLPMGAGVHLSGDIGGLQPGSSHGFHIHEKGDCSAADASSAGGHFNPAMQPHGRAGHGAHHAGDSDNLIANASGVAHVDAQVDGVSLGGNAATNIVGRAIIVHAAQDDYSSQPAGNAGARVACGVIRADQ
jgi:Cu-Zn family superoxide dismutase